MTEIYITEFKQVAKQVWSRWNREPASPSYGSFDRTYWGWKYKDFSDATLQYGVKLAVEYSRMMGSTATLPSLLDGYVTYCAQIQRSDGSFDQAYPYERTPGVVYDILSTLVYVRTSEYLTNTRSQQHLDNIISRAVNFALSVDEKHGEIANHIASFAYELLFFAEYANDDRARRKGEDYLDRLLSLFNEEEGWFQEYQGPDPGYQTRTLRYLVKCADLLNSEELWQVSAKAADFIEAILMPDGSIHPMLGTRSTALIYPSAFEALAIHTPSYQSLANKIRSGWQNELVPLPSWLDFDNAIRLAEDAYEAANIHKSSNNSTASTFETEQLPQIIEGTPSQTNFPVAGITIIHRPYHIIYLGYKLGGVIIVYKKNTLGKWQLVYEDSGYLFKSDDVKHIWLSRMPNAGQLKESSSNCFLIETNFYQSLHDELTSIRLIILRLLNMTLLRNQWVADLFRKIVVGRLMSGRKKIAILLKRELILQSDKFIINDRIINQRQDLPPRLRQTNLFHCRRSIGIHMASSRYFQPQELQQVPLDWIEELNWSEFSEELVETHLEISFNTH